MSLLVRASIGNLADEKYLNSLHWVGYCQTSLRQAAVRAVAAQRQVSCAVSHIPRKTQPGC
jgi:hypothetical protein